LYALILQHLSNKSLDAVQKEAGWLIIEQDVNPEALKQLVENKHKVHSASEVKAMVKLVARTQLAMKRQGSFESIMVFKQRYTNALFNSRKRILSYKIWIKPWISSAK
jgi:hypothetical protein